MRPLLLILISVLMLGAGLPAAAEQPMTDAERTALRAEIHAYLLENPEVLVEMISLLDARKQADAAEGDAALVARSAPAIFDDGFSYVGGNPEGSFTVVEFLDYQCGFCRKAHPEVSAMIADDGDIRLIIKEMPILGPQSEVAARAAIATLIDAGPEAYARLHDALMTLKGQVTDASIDHALTEAGLDPVAIHARMNDDEVTRRLTDTRNLANQLHISGTPTFVFDTRMVRGYVSNTEMRALVSEIRATN